MCGLDLLTFIIISIVIIRFCFSNNFKMLYRLDHSTFKLGYVTQCEKYFCIGSNGNKTRKNRNINVMLSSTRAEE